MKYLSTNKAVQWLNQNATFGNKKEAFNRKVMKKMDRNCRLMPAKRGLFGKRYSLMELKEYARDVKPRF